jgi:hypothetical protein
MKEEKLEGELLFVKAQNLLKRMHIPFPITSKMLQCAIQKRLPQTINIDITFKHQNIIVTGHIKKPIKIRFALHIKPISANKRKLHFEIASLKPSPAHLFKEKLLNRSPFSYENDVLTLDLNKIGFVKRVPIGNVKKMKVKKQRLWCGIGF